jgi:hypothetical protein
MSVSASAAAETLRRESYSWRNVVVGGGGYVTGIVAHPAERDLVYIRTDIGGAYRFSAAPESLGRHWIPLMESIGAEDATRFGVESIAIDPQNADVVFAAVGKYSWDGNGHVLKSTDRGKTWTSAAIPVPMAANGDFRWAGERLAVDPNNGEVVYFGSRENGLWRSVDGGTRWERLAQLSVRGDAPTGIPFVLLDSRHRDASGTKSAVVFIAVYGRGIMRSEDGGASFHDIGGPKHALRGVLTGDGAFFVAAREGVFRLKSGQWTDVTPFRGKEYCAISSDPRNPDIVVVSELRPARNQPLYLTRNGGREWKTLAQAVGTVRAKSDVPWWGADDFAAATAAVAIDPVIAGRLWLTDWSGTWLTDDYLADVVNFHTLERGHEEVVVFTLATPPKGVALLSGVADVNGFRHESLDAFPRAKFRYSTIWYTFGLDYHEADPDKLVRVGSRGEHGDKAEGGVAISTDNGRTWRALGWPFGQPMKVAYSATEPQLFVVLPRNDRPWRTTDAGTTWETGQGINAPALTDYWHSEHPLAADRVKGRTFYLYSQGTFYRSDDGGLTWRAHAGLPMTKRVHIEAETGRGGTVWVSLDDNGLFVSSDGGDHFERLATVKRSMLFGLGRPMPGSARAALYLYGEVDGEDGLRIFRSDDAGRSWVDIADPAVAVGDDPLVIRGDRQRYGRVYVGTGGRGIYVGTPERMAPSLRAPTTLSPTREMR